MIVNEKPTHPAVLGNVSQTGNFQIKNSPKAFGILSSGLYSNKVKAIIRELSCNAWDSHVQSGNSDPFDVHLPNELEPWFSVRDYGTGLSHEQIMSLYTTYFDSTKTGSNDFVGALGLGSKSPFSYTDNFTVTSVVDGWKGIYSAYIDDQGLPAIAQMSSSDTDEANGLCVSFSVKETDFYAFRDESQRVYPYFSVKPHIAGVEEFAIPEINYNEKDIVPGISTLNSSYYLYDNVSQAVMGNVSYPISLSDAGGKLDEYQDILNCRLEIRFDIGELDIQASREGLSYIAVTTDAISSKLDRLIDTLTRKIQDEVSSISNRWEQAHCIREYTKTPLQDIIVRRWYNDSNNEYLINLGKSSYYDISHNFVFDHDTLAEKYNIKVQKFTYTGYSTVKVQLGRDNQIAIPVSQQTAFLINDSKKGIFTRAKEAWRDGKAPQSSVKDSTNVFILNKVDSSKPLLTDEFFADIEHPPENQIHDSSVLPTPNTVKVNRKNTVLEYNYYSYSSSVAKKWVKQSLDQLDDNRTYYYIPLNGYDPISDDYPKPGSIYHSFSSMIPDFKLYGVRKTSLPTVQELDNWVDINTFVQETVLSIDKDILTAMALVDNSGYNSRADLHDLSGITDSSPYRRLLKKTRWAESILPNNYSHLMTIVKEHSRSGWTGYTEILDKINKEFADFSERYPLLDYLRVSTYNKILAKQAADYINIMDQHHGDQ